MVQREMTLVQGHAHNPMILLCILLVFGTAVPSRANIKGGGGDPCNTARHGHAKIAGWHGQAESAARRSRAESMAVWNKTLNKLMRLSIQRTQLHFSSGSRAVICKGLSRVTACMYNYENTCLPLPPGSAVSPPFIVTGKVPLGVCMDHRVILACMITVWFGAEVHRRYTQPAHNEIYLHVHVTTHDPGAHGV